MPWSVPRFECIHEKLNPRKQVADIATLLTHLTSLDDILARIQSTHAEDLDTLAEIERQEANELMKYFQTT